MSYSLPETAASDPRATPVLQTFAFISRVKNVCWHHDKPPHTHPQRQDIMTSLPHWMFFLLFFFLSRLTGIRGLYRGGCSWIQSGSFSSAVVSWCLLLNQISKHNMRSYKNVLMPAGGIELQPWHRQCLVRRKELLRPKKIDTNKNIVYIADKSDFQWNRK